MTIAIEMNRFQLRAGDKPILDRAEFDAGHGTMTMIGGANGCGKSTTMSALGATAARKQMSGYLKVQGHFAGRGAAERDLQAIRRLTAQVPQQPYLQDEFTVAENVGFGALVRGVEHKERRLAVAETLERVGLHHRSRERAGVLNGGDRSRLALAVGLAGLPPRGLVLADEPSAHLSPQSADELLKLFRQLAEEGHAVVVFTHDQVWLRAGPSYVLAGLKLQPLPPARDPSGTSDATHPTAAVVPRVSISPMAAPAALSLAVGARPATRSRWSTLEAKQCRIRRQRGSLRNLQTKGWC